MLTCPNHNVESPRSLTWLSWHSNTSHVSQIACNPIAHLVIALIDGALHCRRAGGYPLDVWGGMREPQVNIALIPSVDPFPQQFHVLLRHRLLLQADGFERLVTV